MLTDAFLEQDIKNMKYIRRFCRQYNVKLLEISVTEENGHPEHAYTFSDDLGYYTIKGIRNSFEEK